jgi:cytochrome P450
MRKISLTVPGPHPTPVFGPAGNVILATLDPIGSVGKMFKVYGPIVSTAAGGGTRFYSPLPDCPGTVNVHGPELSGQVFNQSETYHRYPLTGQMYPLGEAPSRKAPLKHWGAGLMGLNGDVHRQHRRLMMPAFHKQRIELYSRTMVALTEETLNYWKAGEGRDIQKEMMALTRRIATQTLFGQDLPDGGDRIGRTLQVMINMVFEPLTVVLPFDVRGLPYRRFLDLAAHMDAEMRQMIVCKRAKGTDDGDLLSTLLMVQDEDGTRITEDDLLGHLSLLFLAAHETCANALTWTLFLLAQHPQVTADVLDELQGVLQGDPPTFGQLSALPLLERVVKESMRLLPPAPFGSRIAMQAAELGGYLIPSGTEVVVSLYHTHHMPELYPEPERFNPDRWLATDVPSFEYIPFGGGPHMCVGGPFGMMETKIVLAMLLQRFRLQFVAGQRIDRSASFILGPKHGMPMFIQTQDREFKRSVGSVRGNIHEMVELPNYSSFR